MLPRMPTCVLPLVECAPSICQWRVNRVAVVARMVNYHQSRFPPLPLQLLAKGGHAVKSVRILDLWQNREGRRLEGSFAGHLSIAIIWWRDPRLRTVLVKSRAAQKFRLRHRCLHIPQSLPPPPLIQMGFVYVHLHAITHKVCEFRQ